MVDRIRYVKRRGHVKRRPSHHVLRKALRYSLPDKLKRGRPCFTWHHSLQQDMMNSHVTDWEQNVHYKEAHNAKCKELYDADLNDDELI